MSSSFHGDGCILPILSPSPYICDHVSDLKEFTLPVRKIDDDHAMIMNKRGIITMGGDVGGDGGNGDLSTKSQSDRYEIQLRPTWIDHLSHPSNLDADHRTMTTATNAPMTTKFAEPLQCHHGSSYYSSLPSMETTRASLPLDETAAITTTTPPASSIRRQLGYSITRPERQDSNHSIHSIQSEGVISPSSQSHLNLSSSTQLVPSIFEENNAAKNFNLHHNANNTSHNVQSSSSSSNELASNSPSPNHHPLPSEFTSLSSTNATTTATNSHPSISCHQLTLSPSNNSATFLSPYPNLDMEKLNTSTSMYNNYNTNPITIQHENGLIPVTYNTQQLNDHHQMGQDMTNYNSNNSLAIINNNNNNNSNQLVSSLLSPPIKYIEITNYLNMPQSDAAKKLGVPTSTLSKRWKEAARNRKWPFRSVSKLDKEIMTLLHNIPRCSENEYPVTPPEIEASLDDLLRKRQNELKPVFIRLDLPNHDKR